MISKTLFETIKKRTRIKQDSIHIVVKLLYHRELEKPGAQSIKLEFHKKNIR